MITLIKTNYRHIYIDMCIFLSLFLLPSIGHMFPFPIYLIEPMRIAVFTGYLLSKNAYNAALLAITIPIFSFLTTGHPLFFKATLISIELLTNILFFIFLYQKLRIGAFLALVASVVVSKLIYYGIKFLFLSLGLLSGSLVSTGLYEQIITLVILSVVFGILYSRFFKSEKNG